MKEIKISQVPYINIFGRKGSMVDPLPLLFNGSGVEVSVKGSCLFIDIETDSDFHEPWIAYELNGAFMSRQMLLPGEHTICLFRSMDPNNVKTVRFYRELQAMSEDDRCKILVKGFRTDGEFVEVPKYDRKIEFIGDSITSGEGTYGASDDWDWLPMYMGVSNNYALKTAKALNADFHIISQGGWGVYCGWDNDLRHNIPSVYEKVCALATGPSNEAMGTQEMYDFDSWQPDVVIVNLGTNDASAFNQPAFTDPVTLESNKQRLNEDGSYVREDQLKVINSVVDFLKMLRKHNKTAHIVWCYGMLGYDLTLTLTEAITEYKALTGDNNVVFLQLPDTTDDGYGSHMHPGTKSHTVASEVIVTYLKRKLGW